MQVKMYKYLFAGTKRNHDKFFERAQDTGFTQFISPEGKKAHLFPKDVEKAKKAIKILLKHEKKKQEDHSPCSTIDTVKDIIFRRETIDSYYEAKKALKIEIVKAKPFGEFSMKLLHHIEEESNRIVQFFVINHDKLHDRDIAQGLIHVKRIDNMDYFFYIGKNKLKDTSFEQIHIEKSYDEWRREYVELELEIKKLEKEEIESTAFISLIEEYIFARMNSINLNFAKEDVDFLLEDKVFFINAWIPENRLDEIDDLLEGLAIFFEGVAIEKDDIPPTYLKNKGFAQMGEDLVYVYDTPDYSDKDPSRWVLFFFALFFGMIISDAGYGAIFLSVACYFWYKYGKDLKGIKRRMLKTLTLISTSTIVWGVLVSSYFSINVEPASFLNKISIPYNLAVKKVEYHNGNKTQVYKDWVHQYPEIEDVDTPLEMMQKGVKKKGETKVYAFMNNIYDGIFLEISLIVGILHLCISFCRNLYRNYSGIGWIFAILGGYLYFPKVLQGYSMPVYTGLIPQDLSLMIGEQMLYGGVIGAVILSIIQERSLSGVASLLKIIEIFSDALSYLRLYALGLASMVLAGTFNEIGPEIGGPVFGWIIILFGHVINISLGVMAGVIHGLRLNFLEWYHHCYEGGGLRFNPLRLLRRE